MLKELNQKIGRVLVGRYLQGADQSNLLKKMSDETIGISVVGESFFGDGETLVNPKLFSSPAITCGRLSNLIEGCQARLESAQIHAQGVFGTNNIKMQEYLNKTCDEILSVAKPIAYAEGAQDDELKQDIRVLLREGKEQYERRAKEVEEDKKADAEKVITDDTLNGDPDAVVEDDQVDDGGELSDPDVIVDDTTGEEGNDDDDTMEPDTNEDDSEEEPDIPDGKLEGEFEDDEDDTDTNPNKDEEELKKQASEESYNRKLFNEYNSTRAYAEEQRFPVFNQKTICSIPESDLSSMVDKLLKAEEKGFIALGENFDIDTINNDVRVKDAHNMIVKSEAAILCFKRKLNI